MEARKAKGFHAAHAVIIACVLLIAVGVGAAWNWVMNIPVSPQVTVEKLEENMEYCYIALHDDTCYELNTTDMLAQQCGFTGWEAYYLSQYEQKPEYAGEHILTLRLGEDYEVAFYDGGYAMAYYGYANTRKYQNSAWYTVPEDTAQKLVEYIRSNAAVREVYLGADSWFSIDE